MVDVGEKSPVEIVCGAPNVRKGLPVALAKVGAVLPGDFKIKASPPMSSNIFLGSLWERSLKGITISDDNVFASDFI